MNEVMAIASGTWRRILRMKVVYFLIACVLILIWSAVRYEVLSLSHERELMIDISLVLNTIAATLIVISMTFEIPKELREGVASTLLTKPLGRTQYLVGKLVGTIVTGAVISGVIAIGFFAIYKMSFEQEIGLSMLQAHLLIIGSLLPMSAIAILCSVILPEMLSPIITAIAIWLSFSTSILNEAVILYGGILPDLAFFNLKNIAVDFSAQADWGYVILTLVWGILFCSFCTSLASIVFGYKDLK